MGRPVELAAIQQELAVAQRGRLARVTVEGEPGIGKTRLLLAASELAIARGFLTIPVAADEEIRGPLLLARSILGSPEVAAATSGTPAGADVERSLSALSGHDDPGLDSLPPDLPRRRDDPEDRWHVDAGEEGRAPGPLGGPYPHLASGGARARGDQSRYGRGRDPRAQPRTVEIRGTTDPIEVVTVDWK